LRAGEAVGTAVVVPGASVAGLDAARILSRARSVQDGTSEVAERRSSDPRWLWRKPEML
jgi:hypothetical protein